MGYTFPATLEEGQVTVMQSHLLISLLTFIAATVLGMLWRRTRNSEHQYRLPPGKLGLPLIGETIGFLRAFKANKTDRFIHDRAAEFGALFKTSLFGHPTAVFTGPAGNRFLFSNDGKLFQGNTSGTHRRIIGDNSMLEINGDDHKRIRKAFMNFLGPESAQKFVPKMYSVVQQHFTDYWDGNDAVNAVPLMKNLTFSVFCNLLLNLDDKQEVAELFELFRIAAKGIYTVPINIPGTRLRGAIRARSRIDSNLSRLIARRRKDLQDGLASADQDLLSYLLTMTNDDGEPLTDRELKDNVVLIIFAGHETTAMTLALVCKMLAQNPHCYHEVARENEQILANKTPGEQQLTWENIQQLKYTWRVVQETLRITPPVSGVFRKAIEVIEYGGYTIPKGWKLYWSSYTTHCNGDYFPEPEKFDPSRFEGSTVPPYCFLPFGGGPRMCPGSEYAKLEMMIAMHHLVTRNRWSVVIPDEPIVRNPHCVPAMGLPIKLYPK